VGSVVVDGVEEEVEQEGGMDGEGKDSRCLIWMACCRSMRRKEVETLREWVPERV
jgi:hypothetical protein